MALRENLEKEKKKLQRLSFREKLQYIFDYYKFWFLGIAAFLGLVWAVGSTMLHNKPTGFYAMLLNAGGSDLSGEADQAASAAFAAAAGLNDENEKIIVDTSATFNPNDQSQFSMAQNAKIGALYQSHDLDVMVADPSVFTYYALNGSFVDLREVLDDASLSDYEAAGKLYYIDQHVQELLDQTDYDRRFFWRSGRSRCSGSTHGGWKCDRKRDKGRKCCRDGKQQRLNDRRRDRHLGNPR